MVKNKKAVGREEMKDKGKKTFGSKPIVWIVLGVLLIVVICLLVKKDGYNSVYVSDELQELSDNCASYANAGSRADFCKYKLIDGELITCRDSRIIDKLSSEGIDTTIGSLNCKGIDIYSYRKDVCSSLAYGKPETKIADSTCESYQ